LQVITSELKSNILNYRLQNIQNVASSSRQFLLKFSIPDSKKVLVLDCGHRVHLTEFERVITQQPSNFVTKLRKHLKSRRLSSIKQVGNDRVLVLEFSDGLYYLVLEFFSAGNILLLDKEKKILSLQRLVSEKGENDRYAVNEIYNMFDKSLFTEDFNYEKKSYSISDVNEWITAHKAKLSQNQENGKKNKVFSIHKLLFVNASHLSSDLIQKNLNEFGVQSSSSCLGFESNEELLNPVLKALDKTEDDYISLTSESEEITGCIVSKKNPNFNPEDSTDDDLEYVFDEFHPFEPYKENMSNYRFSQIKGYNNTLDSFFSTIESTKYALRIEQQKQQAKNRLDHARNERDKQIQSLVAQQEANSQKGDAIVCFADLVSSCMDKVQKLVDQQMDWTNIESYIKLEQSRGDEIASAIKLPLKLKENKINVLLPDLESLYENDDNSEASGSDSESSDDSSESESESDSDSDSDSEIINKKQKKSTKKPSKDKKKQAQKLAVWIDISLSPYANAALYFDSKKSAEVKQVKVEKNTNLALKNAQKKIQQDLAKNLKQENETLKHIRLKYWFEKFYWFVSSEGYLCLAGRDNSQIDMIYYRHFNDNDYFVSSDVEGSLKVFIKNPFKGEGVPPSTLMQAGIFAMSASSAWNAKVSTSAWLLTGEELSKKDFDGTLISPGEFNYKGKKVYLPPCQLVMGFAFYFLGDEETSEKYKKQRLEREQEHGLKIIMDNKKKNLDDSIGKGIETTRNDRPEEVEANESEEEIVDQVEELKLDESKKVAPKVRGKKAKMKKIAEKYGDQDEDERKMRMDALGTLKQVEELEKQKELELQLVEERKKQKYQESASLQKRKKQDEREYQKYIMEEAKEDEASATNYLEILDSFISKPLTSDVCTGIVPVFAPWASLNKFKYKVKFQPGNGKKGKSINDALNYFTNRKMDLGSTDTDLDWPSEREIVKAAKPNDLVGVFTVSKVKLVLPGGNDSKSSIGKKTNKKRR